MITEDTLRRFWAKAEKTEGCWIWNASKNKQGYGQFKLANGTINGKMILAHRFVWQITYSEIPEGMCVCHTCDNPSCVNPSHLFLGTKSDNNSDKMAKGRHFTGRNAKKLSDEQVFEVYGLREQGLSHREIGMKIGLHHSTIGLILKGQSYPELFAKKVGA